MIRSGFKPKILEPRPARQWTAPELPGPRTPLQRTGGLLPMACQPLPKHTYLRSEPYRRWVGSLACAHCGRAGPSQAAHSDAGGDGKGMSIKADDAALWPGCADEPMRRGCHTLIGSTGMFKREHAQQLAAGYIRKTQAEAIAAGAWPKDWSLPDWALKGEI